MEKSKHDWKRVYAALLNMLGSPQYRMLREGDTLLIINITAPHEGKVFLFTGEKSFKKYIRDVRGCAKALDIAGYEKIYADGANIQIINAVKHAGYNVEAEPTVEKDGVQFYTMTATKGEQ